MYQLFKDTFINPSHISQIEIERLSITEKDGKKRFKAVVTLSNKCTYDFTDEKQIVVGVVNELMAMINVANNPLLSLPAHAMTPPDDQKSDEIPKRIPSDGKGPGSHKVDNTVFPKEKLGPDGYPLKDEQGNIVMELTPELIAKQEADAELKRKIDEGEIPDATGKKAPKKPPVPTEKTGEMAIPPELGEIQAAGPKATKEEKKKVDFG